MDSTCCTSLWGFQRQLGQGAGGYPWHRACLGFQLELSGLSNYKLMLFFGQTKQIHMYHDVNKGNRHDRFFIRALVQPGCSHGSISTKQYLESVQLLQHQYWPYLYELCPHSSSGLCSKSLKWSGLIAGGTLCAYISKTLAHYTALYSTTQSPQPPQLGPPLYSHCTVTHSIGTVSLQPIYSQSTVHIWWCLCLSKLHRLMIGIILT